MATATSTKTNGLRMAVKNGRLYYAGEHSGRGTGLAPLAGRCGARPNAPQAFHRL
jgi:hypothetical protein